jgi:hypothetical protein
MELTGYPSVVLYITLIIGLPLALFKPYKGFLVITFLACAADSTSLTYTRTQFLGPYFNANDACLLIALTATISYGVLLKNKIRFPDVTKLMVAVLLIGFFQSLIMVGESTYEVLRAMRWAVALPVYFVFAATMVDEEKKVKMLLIAILLGSIISSLQHIIFVKSRMETFILMGDSVGVFRTFAFSNPGLWLLLAGIVWMPKIRSFYRPLIYISAVMFAASVFLHQTRSIWISSIAALPIAFVLFMQKDIVKKSIIISISVLVLFVGVLQLISHVLPEIKPNDIILQRIGPYAEQDTRYESTLDRQMDFKLEVEEWMKGTLIFGRGLTYFSAGSYESYDTDDVAWGHLGHVTTLAQLGLIGLFVYSFLLPIIIVNNSRKLWRFATGETKFLGVLAGVCMISSWICFIMSGSFLGQNVAVGIIFGSAYRQAGLYRIQSESELPRRLIVTS